MVVGGFGPPLVVDHVRGDLGMDPFKNVHPLSLVTGFSHVPPTQNRFDCTSRICLLPAFRTRSYFSKKGLLRMP